MKTFLALILLSSFALSQDSVWVRTQRGWTKIASTTMTGGVITITATATVDSTVFVTKTSLDSVKAARSLLAHTHTQANVAGLTDSVAAKPTRIELTTLLGTKEPSISTGTTSQYWRGDKTWQTVTASGGATIQRRTADTTNSIATPVNVGNMSFNVTAGVCYQYRYLLIYSTAATTTGIKVTLTYPNVTVASAGVSIFGQAADGATTETWNGTINSSGDVVTSTAVAVINVPYIAKIEGVILPSADGVVMLKWSPEVAAAATLKNGSTLMYWSY